MQRFLRYFIGCLGVLVSLAMRAQTPPVALIGTLVTPQEIVENGTVVMEGGRIVASGVGVKIPAGTKVIRTDGVIAPGLIDLHNHLTWNIFPRWQPMEEFGSRYDWQQKPVYNVLLTVPHQAIVKEGLECDAERYAEVKAITEGETSVVGSMQDGCVKGLARNLDVVGESELGPGRVIYNVFPLQMSPEALAEAEGVLAATPRGSLLIHIAEGGPKDASAAREFEQLKGRGLLRPGVSLIHAVAIKPEGFAEMAAHGVGFVWSPRSNIELYGDTANVAAAKAAGVKMALAPDWSPTGSVGLLGELNYASVWNQAQKPPLFTERELVLMATSNAAELVNLQAQIGSLAAGHVADVIVVKAGGTGHDAYWTLTHSTAEDVELVVIGGVAMYGDAAMMQSFGGASGERVEVCGAGKVLAAGGKSFAATEKVLDGALRKQGRSLAPLAECGY